MSGQIYIGNTIHAQWAPAPATGLVRTKSGYYDSIRLENGGTSARRSAAYSVDYALDFPVQDIAAAGTSGLEFYQRLADGDYGDGYIYMIDPMWQDQNLMNPVWANPSLQMQGWKSIFEGTTSTSTASSGTTGLPAIAITGNIATAAYVAPVTLSCVFTLLVPTGYTLWLGANGSATGSGVLAVEAHGQSTLVNAAINPSPQDATQLAAGWTLGSAGTGGVATSVRAAAAGVNGGYGFVTTWTTSSTASGGTAGFGSSASRLIGVTPGDTIYPSIYVKLNIAQTLRLGVKFYTSSGADVSTVYVLTNQAIPANTFTRLGGTNSIVVPASADRARIYVEAIGTGAVLFTGTRTNLSKNPNFEADAVNWGARNSATLTRDTSQFHSGAVSLRVDTPGTVTGEGVNEAVAGVASSGVAGVHTVSAWALIPSGVTVRFSADEYTSAAAFVASSSTDITGTGAWQRVSVQRTTATATNIVRLSIFTTSVLATTFYLDDVLIEQSAGLYTYFDGSTSDAGHTYAWTGAANASTSTRSGDTLTLDRVSTARGTYFDGSSHGANWTGVAYASPSSADYTVDTIPLNAVGTAPAFTTSYASGTHKYVRVYGSRTDSSTSTVTVQAVWAQVLPTGQTPTITRHMPGHGNQGMVFSSDAVPENYVMAGRHLVGMSTKLTETEPWD